jgi:exodeoxyribonuclease V alpha subunit
MIETVTLAVTEVLSQLGGGAIFIGRSGDEALRRVIVVGRGFAPAVGEVWQVSGKWRDSASYGRQLHCKAESCLKAPASGALVIPWLQRFAGIGRERAERIEREFRGDIDGAFGGQISIERLAEVIAPDRPNLAARLAAAIVEEWSTVRAEYETVRWLEGNGVDQPRLAIKIAQLLGPQAVEILSRNPYVLATVLPWAKVDDVGLRILRRRPDIDDVVVSAERIVGAIDDTLQSEVQEGHSAMPRNRLVREVARRTILQDTGAFAERVERLGTANRAIITSHRNDAIWRAPGCAIMEDELEARFARMVRGEHPSRIRIPSKAALGQLLDKIEANSRSLHPEQREAVLRLAELDLGCLVGGAGTGKTTTLLAIVRLFEALGGRVEIAALAGKAVLRASESTGRRAWTIYRLLHGLKKRREMEADGETPEPSLPLLDNRTLLVIDESSMVDLGQWHELLEAMPSGCRLLMCGDPMQLPPIGFGLVFHHLAAMEAITARLETIHRQSGASGIPEVAQAIRSGEKPVYRPYAGRGIGVNFYALADGEDLGHVVEKVATDLGGFEGGEHALQIIAPLNEQGSGSVLALNRRFHALRLRSAGIDPETDVVKGHLGQYFAVGDPVTHLTNDYARGLWNGSLGHVVKVDARTRLVVAQFGGDRYEFDRSEVINLGLAYAVTCHRAQGSSARRVIIPIVETRLLEPSWVYTAVTRAEEQAVLIGDAAILDEALRRLPAWKNRLTGCDFALTVGDRTLEAA